MRLRQHKFKLAGHYNVDGLFMSILANGTIRSGSADEAFGLARDYAPDQMLIVQDGLDKEDRLGSM
jgi:hypothetical protein